MSNIINAPPPPKLVLLDKMASVSTPTEILFQYQPTDFTENVASNYASTPGKGRAHPLLQFDHGEQEGFSFQMKLFADHNQINIEDQLDALKAAVRRDDALGRPPRWQFVWGSFVDETVVIQSIGDIKYGDIRNDGSLREVTLPIKLMVYRTIDVALVAEDRPTDTFYSVTKDGEQWEDVALREYDDPLLGELLRRRNPGYPFPGADPGKVVKLPKLATLRNTPIEPSSAPLQRTDEGMALRSKMYDKRSVSRQSTVLKA